MEEKQIYTYSRWKKLQDKFNLVKQEVQKTIQDLKPKTPKVKPSALTESEEIPEKLHPPTPEVISSEKPKLKKVSPNKSKPKIPRRFSLEFDEKILTYTLFFAIIAIVILGIFLSSRDKKPVQELPNRYFQTKTLSPTLMPTPNPTSSPPVNQVLDGNPANWKIYRNEEKEIELKYPQDWTVEETTSTVTYFIGPFKGPDPIVGYIFFYTNLDEAINDMGHQFEQRNVTRQEITINGWKALRVTVTTPEIAGWSMSDVLMTGEKYIYRIWMGDPRLQFADVEQKILSTFKFLDNNSACFLAPQPGSCKALTPGYYFDSQEKICKRFIWGGCEGVRPFATLEECKMSCE